jgi:hypothetical protein
MIDDTYEMAEKTLRIEKKQLKAMRQIVINQEKIIGQLRKLNVTKLVQ